MTLIENLARGSVVLLCVDLEVLCEIETSFPSTPGS